MQDSKTHVAICILSDFEITPWLNPRAGEDEKFPNHRDHRHVSRTEARKMCHGDAPKLSPEQWVRAWLRFANWRLGVRGKTETHDSGRCEFCRTERQGRSPAIGPRAEWVGPRQIRSLHAEATKDERAARAHRARFSVPEKICCYGDCQNLARPQNDLCSDHAMEAARLEKEFANADFEALFAVVCGRGPAE